MTFTVLRSLHTIVGEALDEIEGIYASSGCSSPSESTSSTIPLDFPSLDVPCDQTSPSEALTTHPAVLLAISRIIAAAGQMSATVQTPFLSLCDATMGVSQILMTYAVCR